MSLLDNPASYWWVRIEARTGRSLKLLARLVVEALLPMLTSRRVLVALEVVRLRTVRNIEEMLQT